MESWQSAARSPAALRSAPDRIRVGIASAQLREHSVWNAIVKGWVKHLDESASSCHLFNLGAKSDAETEQARELVASAGDADGASCRNGRPSSPSAGSTC